MSPAASVDLAGTWEAEGFEPKVASETTGFALSDEETAGVRICRL